MNQRMRAGSVGAVDCRPERQLTLFPRRSFLALALASSLVVAPASRALGQSDDLEGIRRRLTDAQNQTARVLNDLKSIDSRIYSVGRSIAADEAQVADLRKQIDRAEAHVAELESEMDRVRQTSNARARRMYMNGPARIVSVLFNATSFGDLPRMRVFFESLAARDDQIIVEAARLKEDLEVERTELAAAVEELRGRVEALDAEREDLRESREARTQSLADLKVAIEQAQAAEKAVLAARAAATKKPEPAGTCTPGIPARDQRLATLLNWYAPAAGGAGFMPEKLSGTGVVTSGEASWYGPGFDGCRSASGATFRASQMTAASLSLPMGTLLKVSRGGRAVVVVITDRGPYTDGRVLDLSEAAAKALNVGVGVVDMEILLPVEPAPPFP